MTSFWVHGIPVTQGSTRAFVVKGRAIVTNKTPGLDQWRKLVAAAAQPYAHMIEGPVGVRLRFLLARPKSLPKTRRSWATKKPDIDRLTRAILDALTGVMFTDDAQVISLDVRKDYAQIGGPIGVDIEVWGEVDTWPLSDTSEGVE